MNKMRIPIRTKGWHKNHRIFYSFLSLWHSIAWKAGRHPYPHPSRILSQSNREKNPSTKKINLNFQLNTIFFFFFFLFCKKDKWKAFSLSGSVETKYLCHWLALFFHFTYLPWLSKILSYETYAEYLIENSCQGNESEWEWNGLFELQYKFQFQFEFKETVKNTGTDIDFITLRDLTNWAIL